MSPSSQMLDILHSIYQFKHLPASVKQDEQTIQAFRELLKAFAASKPLSHLITHISTSLHGCEDKDYVFFPQYGCVLVIKTYQKSLLSVDEAVEFFLLCPDSWEFEVHRGNGFSSTPSHNSCLHIGSLPVSKASNTLASLKQKIAQAVLSKGLTSNRFTPSFILSVTQNVLNPDLQIAPKGGFSDIGILRSVTTCWPLVISMLQHIVNDIQDIPMPKKDLALSNTLVQFHLWLAGKLLATCLPTQEDAKVVYGCVVEIVQHVSWILYGLARKGLYAQIAQEGFEAQVMDIRAQLDACYAQTMDAMQSKYSIPENSLLSSIKMQCISLNPLPTLNNLLQLGALSTKQHLISLAQPNLAYHPLLALFDPAENGQYCPVSVCLDWLTAHCSNNILSIHSSIELYAIHLIEQRLFHECKIICDAVSWDALPMVIDDITLYVHQIAQLSDHYRRLLHIFLQANTGEILSVEYKSKYVLISWTTACLLHKVLSLSPQYTALKQYSLDLDPQYLRYLVCSERSHWEMIQYLAAYLYKMKASKTTNKHGPIFSLENELPTYKFAQQFVTKDPILMQFIQAEQVINQQRIKDRWTLIESMKQHVTNLEKQLDELIKKEKQRNIRKEKKQEFADLIYKKRLEIATAKKKMPPRLFLSLPKNSDFAKLFTFFLKLPDALDILANYILLAQCAFMVNCQMKDDEEKESLNKEIKLEVPAGFEVQILKDYAYEPHTTNKINKVYKCNLGSIVDRQIPVKLGQPENIFSYTHPEYDAFYPDDLMLQKCMLWTLSTTNAPEFAGALPTTGCYIRPHIIYKYLHGLAMNFTQKVSLCGTNQVDLNWMMFQPGWQYVSPDRGHLMFAKLCPQEWSKQEFLMATSIRAYPLQQLRKLCSALHNNTLSFEYQQVHNLFKQALYQLGDIDTTKTTSTLLWKKDWFTAEWQWQWLEELGQQVEVLSNTPKNMNTILLIGELLSFTSQWLVTAEGIEDVMKEKTCLAIRKLSKAAYSFAQDIQTQKNNVILGQETIDKLKESQIVYCTSALVCYCLMPTLEKEDIVHIGTVIVLANSIKEKSLDGLESQTCKRLRDLMIAHQLAPILHILTREFTAKARNDILTTLVQLIISSCPTNLSWEQEQPLQGIPQHLNACFHAFDMKTNSLYSINLMNGIVLFNGVPPDQLPLIVLNHPLYQRHFSTHNFETICPRIGVLRTSKLIGNCYYQFEFDTSGNGTTLVIKEWNATLTRCLTLLSYEHDWNATLPIRLRTLYSHWLLWEDGKKVIVFRPIHFHSKEIQYLSIYDEVVNCWTTYFIPAHSHNKSIDLLLEDAKVHTILNQLVTLNEPKSLIQCITCYENADFIEYYANQKDGWCHIWLPRYNLHFQTDNYYTNAKDLMKFKSLDFAGFYLASSQQLDYFPWFHDYLILEKIIYQEKNKDDDAMETNDDEQRVEFVVRKVLIPQTRHDNRLDEQLLFYTYDIHPRFHTLLATTIESRLFLALLCVQQHCHLPEPSMQMTGVEMAMELIRQCWKNFPLTKNEMKWLQELLKLSIPYPSLAMLCHDLQMSTTQLKFLHDNNSSSKDDKCYNSTAHSDAITAYYNHRDKQRASNIRLSLTDDEETRLLPFPSHCSVIAEYLDIYSTDPVHVAELKDYTTQIKETGKTKCKTSFQALQQLMMELRDMIEESIPDETNNKNQPEAQVFPLSNLFGDQPLAHEMLSELQESWFLQNTLPTYALVTSLPQTLAVIKTLYLGLCIHRQEIETFLLCTINTLPTPNDMYLGCFQAGNVLSKATINDLIKFTLTPHLMPHYNPSVHDADAMKTLHQLCILWCHCCVYEDKLQEWMIILNGVTHVQHNNQQTNAYNERIAEDMHNILHRFHWYHNDDQQEAEAMQSAFFAHNQEHIEWLVYEVEQRLAIRPVQFDVAKSLIGNLLTNKEGKEQAMVGAIHQLNMGEGKTKVILPLVVLYLTRKAKDCVIREVYLPQLLFDAYQHMHQTLTASCFHKKLFLFPFHRNIELTPARIRSIQYQLQLCQNVGGSAMIASNHRLSMILKTREGDPALADALLNDVENGFRYLDILDESDELLRYKYELVYAVGAGLPLPSGRNRWVCVQAILRALHMVINKRQQVANCPLRDEHFGLLIDAKYKDEFPSIRLFPKSSNANVADDAAFDQKRQHLSRLIVDELFANPPYELLWLHRYKAAHVECKAFLTNPMHGNITALQALLNHHQKDNLDYVFDDLLALRGYLACDIFCHCLEKRHRVNYGIKQNSMTLSSSSTTTINTTSSVANCDKPSIKRLAVPFVAADTPSPRSEFANIDCALLYTTLSYYYDGLSGAQVIESFKCLLSKRNPMEQQEIYHIWFVLSRPRIQAVAAADVEMLDSIQKIDLSNALQTEKLIVYFQKNQETINYWLNNIVFLKDTGQFPAQMMVTAWDLCHHNLPTACPPVGFSGTNATKVLLPLQVQQQDVVTRPELLATNGKMLSMVLRDCNSQYFPLELNPDETVWKGILRVLRIQLTQPDNVHNYRALIDAGGLIVGVSNRLIGKALLQFLPAHNYRGVIYFDTDQDRVWKAINHQGQEWCLTACPFHESEGFVYYDEARCRGSDMKLSPNARALVTLGLQMNTDKLMQAIGRMRQLKYQQSVTFVGTPDITLQIYQLNKLHQATPAVSLSTASANAIDTGNEEEEDEDEKDEKDENQAKRLKTSHSHGQKKKKKQETKITSLHLLQWTIYNTIMTITQEGLLQWSKQGLHFLSANQSQKYTTPLTLDLSTLYGISFVTQSLQDIVVAFQQQQQVGMNQNQQLVEHPMIQTIHTRIGHYHGHEIEYVITTTMVDNECERELCKELELEEEIEQEILIGKATEEVDWDCEDLLSPNITFHDVVERSAAMKMSDVLLRVFPSFASLLEQLGWSKEVYATKNFLATVESTKPTRLRKITEELKCYLACVDAILYFPAVQSMVILSDRECCAVLQACPALQSTALVSASSGNKKKNLNNLPRLVHLTYCIPQPSLNFNTRALAVPPSLLVTMHLFQGTTSYPLQQEITALIALIYPPDTVKHVSSSAINAFVLDLLAARQLLLQYHRSDLEKLLVHHAPPPSTGATVTKTKTKTKTTLMVHEEIL